MCFCLMGDTMLSMNTAGRQANARTGVPGQARMRAQAAGKNPDDELLRLMQQLRVRKKNVAQQKRSHAPKRSHKPPATRTDLLAATPAMWVADIVVTLMVIIALFWVYSSWFTNIAAGKNQAAATREISGVWDRSGGSAGGDIDPTVGDTWMAGVFDGAAEGTPLMKMYVPRLGNDWQYTVVKGVTQESLAKGPGLYTSTQLPGQRGNMALAGHRDGNGAPFFSADSLRTCDAIVVETRDNWYTYRVLPGDLSTGEVKDAAARRQAASDCLPDVTVSMISGTALNGTDQSSEYGQVAGVHVTTPDDNSVLAPVPGYKGTKSGAEAGIALPMLTITTCHPLYFNYQRLIVHAVLERVDPVVEGQVPEALKDNTAAQGT